MCNKIAKVSLIFSLIAFLITPNLAQGRVKEKAVTWDSSIGHNHDGVTSGKKVDSTNVVNTPFGDISADNVQSAVNELDTEKINASEKGAPNGVATLDSGAKILAVQLPAIAVTDVYVCASQVCQLALVVEEGDVCIRSDENLSYIHNGGIVGDMTDWNVLLSTGVVTSIQGETGDVSLDHSDLNNITASAHHSSTSDGLTITPSLIDLTGALGSTILQTTKVTGDTNPRLTISGDGTLCWGDGTAVVDTTLFRLSSDTLATMDTFQPALVHLENASAGNSVLQCFVTGDSTNRLALKADGKIYAGSGAGVIDCAFYRESANLWTLGLGDNFRVKGGTIFFDSDTSLYRSAAHELRTNDAFVGGQNITVYGSMYVDFNDATNRLYFGSGLDTSLFRSAANTLKTEDSVVITGVNGLTVPTITCTNTASSYIHATTTKYMTYGSQHAVLSSGSDPASFFGVRNEYILPSSADSVFDNATIGVNLPSGAIVTEFLVTGYTTGSTTNEVSVIMYRASRTDTSVWEMATVTFNGGTTSGTDSTISNTTISNITYRYFIHVTVKAATLTGDSKFYAARIKYTTSNVKETM